MAGYSTPGPGYYYGQRPTSPTLPIQWPPVNATLSIQWAIEAAGHPIPPYTNRGIPAMTGDQSLILDYQQSSNGTLYDNGLSSNTMDYYSNTGGDGDEFSSKYSLLESILIGIFLGLVIFFSIAGNLLVCVAILTDRNLRKTSNFFIISLAVADMLVAILVMSFAVANDIAGYWIFNIKFCSIWICFDIMCSTASILNLCAISLDRYIHIRSPFQYDSWVTPFRTCLAICLVWLLSAFISFVPIQLGWHQWGLDMDNTGSGNNQSNYVSTWNDSGVLETSQSQYKRLDTVIMDSTAEGSARSPYYSTATDPGGRNPSSAAGAGVPVYSAVDPDNPGGLPPPSPPPSVVDHYYCIMELNPIYAVVSSMISFFLPCLVMISIYVQLYMYARRQMASIKRMQIPTINHGSPSHGNHHKAPGSSQSKISDHKAAITLGIIMGVFLFCWTPFFVVNIIGAFCPACIPPIVFSIFTWLGYFNSTLNPVIYSIFNSEFRHAFKRVLGHVPCFYRCCQKDDYYRRSTNFNSHGAYGTVSEKTPMNCESARTQLTQV